MAQVIVKYNPYRLKTEMQVNGKEIKEDSVIYKLLKGKRLQEWLNQFPQMLVDEFNSVDFDIEFCGMALCFLQSVVPYFENYTVRRNSNSFIWMKAPSSNPVERPGRID